MATKHSVVFRFQTPGGDPLAFGRVRIRLNTDASTASPGGIQVAATRIVFADLDSTGEVTVALWANTDLSPAGTVYVIWAYSAQGEIAWQGEITVTPQNFIMQEDTTSFILLEGSIIDALLQE
jgi:hypothetical protein